MLCAGFDPLTDAACVLDPQLAPTLLVPEMATLLLGAKEFVVHDA